MNDINILDEMIEQKVLGLRTGLVGKVIKTDCKTADVQPLQMFRQTDGTYERNPILLDVPVMQHVCRFDIETVTDSRGDNHEQIKIVPLAVGDVVMCVCSDRDLENTIDGKFDKPTRHHNVSDAVVVGIF